MSLHGRAAYPIPPPSRPRIFGWLLHDKISNSSQLRPWPYFIFVIFWSFNLPPQNKKNTPLIHSTPAVHPLHHPSYCCLRLLVDCCVLQPNGGHLRPRTHLPLYFLMHPNLAAQPREPATARANPLPGACNRLVGSCGTMIWGHDRCCHGDLGQSRWGWEAAAHLVFLFCVVCCVCVRSLHLSIFWVCIW
jgi:hypothetical protein